MRIRALTRNIWWKLASLAVSVGLWLSYSGARESTISITAQVQYRNIPKDLEISSDIVEQVHLVLRGPSPLLTRIAATQLPVTLDLSAIHNAGQTTFTIDRRNVSLGAGITLERAVPSQIRLRMDDREIKQVPVVVRFENVPAGFEIASAEVTPERLTIVGPKSRVSLIEQLETDPVNLAGVAGQAQMRTTAFSGHPRVTFESSPSVTVKITLQAK